MRFTPDQTALLFDDTEWTWAPQGTFLWYRAISVIAANKTELEGYISWRFSRQLK